MILDSINIQRVRYGKDEGKLAGKIEFKSELGAVEINLDDELSTRVLRICADELVNASKQVAKIMTSNILEQQKVIT